MGDIETWIICARNTKKKLAKLVSPISTKNLCHRNRTGSTASKPVPQKGILYQYGYLYTTIYRCIIIITITICDPASPPPLGHVLVFLLRSPSIVACGDKLLGARWRIEKGQERNHLANHFSFNSTIHPSTSLKPFIPP